MSSKYLPLGVTLAFAALVGCAQIPGPSEGQTAKDTAAQTAPNAALSAGTASPATPPTPAEPTAQQKLAADGTLAEFDPAGSELSDEAVALITEFSTTAAQAKRVEVTGHCDRRDNEKNAKQLALKRALAVRNELVKHGVANKKIRVKYLTSDARQTVTVTLK
jgi:outer membrane protein OmpA-like peptidoglycan-associated protein